MGMKKLTIELINEHVFGGEKFEIEEQRYNKLSSSFQFLEDFCQDKIIYGINTGFGPMVQVRIEPEDLDHLQYNLIRSHSTGLGDPLTPAYAKSVVLARLNSMLQGNSGVSIGVMEQLQTYFNKGIVPYIPEHGSVGASGDLVQLAHLGLNLIGEGKVWKGGAWRPTAEVLKEEGIKPLKLKLRDGLAIINGTSCMSGIAAINLIYAQRLQQLGIIASCIINEINDSFDDSFSKELNEVKLHKGQNDVAKAMRDFLHDSKLIKQREELFNDGNEIKRKTFKNKIQGYYSIRCVPQILGPVVDTVAYAKEVVENEINSTNDNPIVSPENNNVFHGGNFHGDYISLEMDKLKLVITKMTMLMERQLNYLLNDKLNWKFPPFINAGKLGLNFGYQGIQFTATSTTSENQALSTSVYIHSIPNNNDNQDIVSMGTNSALMAKKVIDNGFQVMAIHLMAICQAVDLLSEDEKSRLCTNTKKVHAAIREKMDFFADDSAMYEKTEQVIELIKENDIL